MLIGLSLAITRNGLTGPSGPTNTVAPVVSGTATVGQTLSCTTGTWSGEGTITYAYQWLDDGATIPGATSSTYTLTAGEEGGFISCRVTATDDNGSTAATSNSLGPVAASSFSPADLFGVGDEGFFHDFSDTSTLYTDLAGTTAVTASGDPIGFVDDASGKGNNLESLNTSTRPTYTVSGALAGAAYGASAGERLLASAAGGVTGLTNVNNCTMVVAYTSVAFSALNNPLRLGSVATGDYAEVYENTTSPSIRSNPEGLTVDNTSTSDTSGAGFVTAGVKDGTDGRWYKYASGSGGLVETDTGLGTFAADMSAEISVRGNGNTIYAVFFINKAITGTDFTNLIDWFRAKAGH